MKVVECSLKEFVNRSKGKKIVCYGAGLVGKAFINAYKHAPWFKRIAFFIDNSDAYNAMAFYYNEQAIPIKKLKDMVFDEDTVVLLTTGYGKVDSLMSALEEQAGNVLKEVYVLGILWRNNENKLLLPQRVTAVRRTAPQIPKILHYCWFGGKEIPRHLQEFMKSWQRYCPDWEIKRWDESNYDLETNGFLMYALKNKNYAYCSDFARLDVIYRHGGIYLDCDVEIVRDLDELRYYDAFIGKNFNGLFHFQIATGSGVGAKKGHPLIKEMRDYYITMGAEKYDYGCALLQYQVLKNYNEKCTADNTFNVIDRSMVLFPFEFFHPYDMYGYGRMTENAYCVHHSEFSWKKDPLKVPKFLTKLQNMQHETT